MALRASSSDTSEGVDTTTAAVIGVVENMSYLIAPKSGERIDVFGQGGGQRMAETMGVPFLGELPLEPEVRMGGDSGKPIAIKGAGDPHAKAFHTMAETIRKRLEETGGPKAPRIDITD